VLVDAEVDLVDQICQSGPGPRSKLCRRWGVNAVAARCHGYQLAHDTDPSIPLADAARLARGGVYRNGQRLELVSQVERDGTAHLLDILVVDEIDSLTVDLVNLGDQLRQPRLRPRTS
jgi:hypothetical protein